MATKSTGNPFDTKATPVPEAAEVEDILTPPTPISRPRPPVDESEIETYGGSTNRRAEIAPKHFRIGDDPHVFTVYEPDAGTVMDIEEGGSSRRILALFLGDEWGKAEALLEGEQPDALVDMAQGLSRHFKLYSGAPEGNRAARRRESRRR